ncbi:MAG TPA: hypothetical protein VK402_11695 [Blastococcus sp.]|nr:hypothetical protein [Blastococcus sp.]
MTAMSQAVRETRDGETVMEIQDGEDVGAPDLDAIERMYEEAKACIAEATGWPAPETADPWPETEAIDVGAITPPAPSRRSGPAPDPTSAPGADESPASALATDRLAVAPRPWRRWFSPRARESGAPR